jgi:hypothetical protein
VVEAAVADVVGPAVAADDPHAARHERRRVRAQRPGLGRGVGREEAFELVHAGALGRAPRVAFARRAQPVDEHRGQSRREEVEQAAGPCGANIHPEAHAETKLGVVLEERVGPRGAAPLGVGGVRRRGEVAAVDGRAARRVGDEQVITEELREEADVRRLAAARTRPGKLKQRQVERRGALVEGQRVEVSGGQGLEEGEGRALGLAVIAEGLGDEGLAPGLEAVFGGAHRHAEPAAGAVLGGDLHGVVEPRGRVLEVARHGAKTLRRADEGGGVKHAGLDGRVGADHRAEVALHAEVGLPDGDVPGEGALLVLARADGPGAVGGKRRHGKVVAVAFEDEPRDALHEVGRVGGHGRGTQPYARRRGGYGHREERRAGGFESLDVAADDLLAAAAPGVFHRAPEVLHRLGLGQYA